MRKTGDIEKITMEKIFNFLLKENHIITEKIKKNNGYRSNTDNNRDNSNI
jgi:hypothetical protein